MANDATSYLVKGVVEKYSARWKEVEVGEINVVNAMRKHKAIIGGEGSNGGIIIPPGTCRDSILTLLLVLRILSQTGKSLPELVGQLPPYTTLQEKARALDRRKVEQYYAGKGFRIQATGDAHGGLKAISPDGWIWFRESRTEPRVVRIIADSKSASKAKSLMKEAMGLLAKAKNS